MKVRCNQCMAIFDEEQISYDGETEFCPECGESGCLMDLSEIRYYICGLGYNKNNCITDAEIYFGEFDTYEAAYEEFVKLQCKDTGWFFNHTTDIDQLLLQLEECEETEEEINCIDVKNEWWITNPNFKEEV